MLKVIQHIFLLPLFISAVLSLKAFVRQWPAPYRIFSVLLLSVLFVEVFALLWKVFLYNAWGWSYQPSNLWIYNSALLPQYLLYLLAYYRVLRSPALRRTIVRAACLFTAFFFINITYLQPITTINSYSIIMASGIITFLTVSYFEQVRKSTEIITLTADPMAWISLGAFIFHAANLPYMISLNYLNRFDVSLAISIFYIYMALNCIMYTFYSIAFLCNPPSRT